MGQGFSFQDLTKDRDLVCEEGVSGRGLCSLDPKIPGHWI